MALAAGVETCCPPVLRVSCRHFEVQPSQLSALPAHQDRVHDPWSEVSNRASSGHPGGDGIRLVLSLFNSTRIPPILDQCLGNQEVPGAPRNDRLGAWALPV